ncbi:uncharacterized protein PHACADRAFT_158734 [Phanerochaete carnosa HHB-10118-sp]|uniref:Uncharacterized protein n=1 Tax=Phanerochaete carnosa (strain HHB-10118-sp) TaxID=650164 RepID=K5V4Y6_PHACS|nr:uncharacterized protein PHACADRAFT_158734 [Phanerochaete carnosa HHB-10118-sp]EKM57696.1 hypothetical protein PHACADRAFT_158734 [Phanerochaete carnosa HHB-10118-sp]
MSKTQESGPEVPLSTMPYPPLHADKRFVVLSDWLVPFMVRPDGLYTFLLLFHLLEACADPVAWELLPLPCTNAPIVPASDPPSHPSICADVQHASIIY